MNDQPDDQASAIWQQVREHLTPLTDWIPPSIRDLLQVEVWWLLELVVVLSILLLIGYTLRAFFRLFRWQRKVEWDVGLREQLDSLPVRTGPTSLSVYHIPAHLQLVVVAPVGKDARVDVESAPLLLERAIPGLGAVIRHDQPAIRIWPEQLSAMGFTNSFHRCTPTGKREDEPSEWILLAGRAQGGGQSLFVGLALRAEQPTTLGRRNLEPQQWLELLRLTNLEGRP